MDALTLWFVSELCSRQAPNVTCPLDRHYLVSMNAQPNFAASLTASSEVTSLSRSAFILCAGIGGKKKS